MVHFWKFSRHKRRAETTWGRRGDPKRIHIQHRGCDQSVAILWGSLVKSDPAPQHFHSFQRRGFEARAERSEDASTVFPPHGAFSGHEREMCVGEVRHALCLLDDLLRDAISLVAVEPSGAGHLSHRGPLSAATRRRSEAQVSHSHRCRILFTVLVVVELLQVLMSVFPSVL